ncbi:hypothetical protein GHT06_021575 [Daphnia sinensis]|uniref:BING4 C-terminal domain-containing protein n=1 Tax=Daphnia sinensis TaxID=1820382 RepID=A0AAD5PSL8_9CRUS|nr:hypothetical protein GHT06_021575 [Daphnia sinensis]
MELKKEKVVKLATKPIARLEILLPEEVGFLEAGKGESTADITQVEIKSSVDITSATKQFDLSLQFGPYAINYLRNGRKMLISGRMGHVAAFDWVTKELTCEMNVMESVHDVAWLHNETLFAVAQKNWTYIYDNQGIEVHCIKKLNNVRKMEYLPYHFLLATTNDSGTFSWLDVSIGKMVQRTHTHLGRLDVLCQNPSNAVLCCGHSKGTVSMWTPNFVSPVIKMLCHRQPVRSVAIDQTGRYMATSSLDSTLKIWDLRTYNCLQSYKLASGASNLTFSQRGLLAVSLGNIVEVYKDICTETVRQPYIKHFVGNSISGLKFCPYEDVLGVGHARGICSMLVPGAGEPNFDALEANPFQTKSQRTEAEVKSLLEKIQPELITLDSFELGEVNRQAVIEKWEEKTKYMSVKPPKVDLKPRKNAKTVNKFRIKQRLQQERQKKHSMISSEIKQNLVKNTIAPRKPEIKPSVLDRFKIKTTKK